DFVRVHVRRRAGAGLEHVDRKLPVEFSGGDTLRRLADHLRLRLRQMAHVAVGLRRRRLDQAEGADELTRHRQSRYREVVDRALGLGTVKRIGRYFEIAHAVALDAELAHCRPIMLEEGIENYSFPWLSVVGCGFGQSVLCPAPALQLTTQNPQRSFAPVSFVR